MVDSWPLGRSSWVRDTLITGPASGNIPIRWKEEVVRCRASSKLSDTVMGVSCRDGSLSLSSVEIGAEWTRP